MQRFKLTNQSLRTYNGFQWKVGKEVTTSGTGHLCTSGWLHCYTSPLLAVLLNPIHGKIDNPILWEVKATGKHKTDHGLKEGWSKMTLIKKIELPVVTQTQRIAFAILCAKAICKDRKFTRWANDWLTNKDRTKSTAFAIAAAARNIRTTAYTYDAIVYAARTAAYSSEYTTAEAARCVAYSRQSVAYSRKSVDLIKLAEKAMKY